MALGEVGLKSDHMEKSHKSAEEMTMHDIKAAFKEDFMDEVEDANKYCTMAHTAEMAGHEHLEEGLYEMALDEYTHAAFIHENLIDWGCEIPETEMMKWHELKERIDRKFRR